MTEIDAIVGKLAGVAGACVSFAYLKGTFAERITNATGGALVSLYASGWLAAKTGVPESLAGFLMGMFGMAICAKGWELIHATPIGEVWAALLGALRKRLGG